MRAAVWVNNINDRDEVERLEMWCRLHHYEITAMIHDAEGIASAARMYADGEIDVLVVASRRHLPLPIEITTVEIALTQPRQTGRRPRPQRLRRNEAESESPPAAGPR